MMLIMTSSTFRSMAQFQEPQPFIALMLQNLREMQLLRQVHLRHLSFLIILNPKEAQALLQDLSTPVGPYTITASITIPNDPDLSNNVSTSLDIGVFTPAVPSLSSSADPDNIICAGDPITFTITPFSATATYTFKINNGIVQSLFGVNSITFTTGALGNIANGDVVTIDMIDGNGCVTSSATQSRTVTVSGLPTAGLFFCSRWSFL